MGARAGGILRALILQLAVLGLLLDQGWGWQVIEALGFL